MITTKLDDYRKSIDLLDAALVTILAERLRVVEKVGQYKKTQKIPPLSPERWQKVLSSKKTLAKSLGISETLIERIYTAIHEEALRIEHQQS